MRLTAGVVALSASMLAACAPSSGSVPVLSRPGDVTVITRSEIDTMRAKTAYDIVFRRRRDFISRKVEGVVRVYLDREAGRHDSHPRPDLVGRG